MSSLDPVQKLSEILDGFKVTSAVSAAVKLNIAETLSEKSHTAGELAQSLGCHEGHLKRLLDFLCAHELFTESNGKYAHSELSQLLDRNRPNSLVPYTEMFSQPWCQDAFGALSEAVKTGGSSFEIVHGMDLFQYLAKNRQAGDLFDKAMETRVLKRSAGVVENYDFSKARVIADLGGGTGFILLHILKANAHLKGVLFDYSEVLKKAEISAAQMGVGVRDRIRFEAGSFFEKAPEGCDVHFMSHIMHDWDDERCIEILTNCRKVLPPPRKSPHPRSGARAEPREPRNSQNGSHHDGDDIGGKRKNAR